MLVGRESYDVVLWVVCCAREGLNRGFEGLLCHVIWCQGAVLVTVRVCLQLGEGDGDGDGFYRCNILSCELLELLCILRLCVVAAVQRRRDARSARNYICEYGLYP